MVFESFCSDEIVPVEYEEWLDWKDTVDPAFEVLKKNLPDCGVCGEADLTAEELDLNNGRCPGCDSKIDDIPF